MIQPGHLRAIGIDDERWLWAINNALMRYEINTANRVAMFLAQCAHESGGFRHLVESLNYSAAALRATWPNRFTEAEAADMARDQARIGERAYGGRMGNGPEGSGDGFKYRGRGIIQITGRETYGKCGDALRLDLINKPELLEDPEAAALSAGWYWSTHGCNALADANDFEGVTRRINGGINGLADRRAWLAKVYAAMGTQPGDRIKDNAPPPLTQRKGNDMGAMFGAGLIGELLKTVLSKFEPLARQKIEAEVGKVDPTAATALADAFMGMINKATGIVDPVQAVAAVTAATPEAAAKLATVQADTLEYLDKLAPMINSIARFDKEQREASDASFDRAAVRASTPEGWKLRWLQATFVQRTVGWAILVIAALIGALSIGAIWMSAVMQTTISNILGQLVVLEVTLITGLITSFRDQIGFAYGGTADGNASATAMEEVRAARNERNATIANGRQA